MPAPHSITSLSLSLLPLHLPSDSPFPFQTPATPPAALGVAGPGAEETSVCLRGCLKLFGP